MSIFIVTAVGAIPVAKWSEGRYAFADRQSLLIPSQDPDYGELGPAFPPWPGPADGAILQPPQHEIQPTAPVLERTADRDADREAAD